MYGPFRDSSTCSVSIRRSFEAALTRNHQERMYVVLKSNQLIRTLKIAPACQTKLASLSNIVFN